MVLLARDESGLRPENARGMSGARAKPEQSESVGEGVAAAVRGGLSFAPRFVNRVLAHETRFQFGYDDEHSAVASNNKKIYTTRRTRPYSELRTPVGRKRAYSAAPATGPTG